MSLRSALLLILVLGVLCCGYAGMLQYEKHKATQVLEERLTFSFKPEDIVAAEVKQLGQAAVGARLGDDGVWKMTGDYAQIPANPILWPRIAKALAGLENQRVISESPSDLKPYGLDAPDLTLAFETKTGAKVKLSMGAIEPTQANRYAMLDDGRVFLVSVKTYQELDRSLLDLRDRFLFALGAKGVSRIEYARIWTGRLPASEGDPPSTEGEEPKQADPAIGEESVKVVLELGPDNLWKMTAPIEAMADQARAEALVREVQYLMGQEYIDKPQSLDDYGLNPAIARVTAWNPDGKSQTVYFGSFAKPEQTPSPAAPAKPGAKPQKPKGGLFVKQADYPAVAIAEANILQCFPKQPYEFRDSHLISKPMKDLQRVRFKGEGTEFVLMNDAKLGWQLESPNLGETDQALISDYIATLKDMCGMGFPEVTREHSGVDAPRIELALEYGDGSPARKMLIGREVPDAHRSYVLMDDGVTVTEINELQFANIVRQPTDFLARVLVKFDAESADRIAMQVDGKPFVFEKSGNLWSVNEPAGKAPGAQGDIKTLVANLSHVEALAVVSSQAPENMAAYGFDAPSVALQVQSYLGGDSAKPVSMGILRIGKVTDDNSRERFAVTDGKPGVYRVSQGLVDAVRSVLDGLRDR